MEVDMATGPLPIKTYYPTLARTIFELGKFITKHRATLLAVCAIVSPADAVAVDSAFTAILTFVTLFEKIHSIIDPNAPPEE
jgi:hypothetical protein